jgi:hypothetical protein
MTKTAALRRAFVRVAVGVGRAVLRRPQLKYFAKQVLAMFPSVRTRVQDMMYKAAFASASRLSNRVKDDADLSPRTIRMLRALKRAAPHRGAE